MIVQGRLVGQAEIALVRRLLHEHPDWHRTRLSRELCQAWCWHNGAGRLKDMACRTLLLKLESRGLIKLPSRRRPSVNAARNRRVSRVKCAQEPVSGSVEDLLPLRITPVQAQGQEVALFRSLIGQHHYLGLRNTVGENLKYLIRDVRGRLLCCALFGSAAWQCKARDDYIGWDGATRQRNLWLLTNNTRFVILPWVGVRNLASHVLSRIARRIGEDWEGKYGHAVWALETFVDRSRFTGACYQAANWRKLGQTTGRTRNDRSHRGPLSTVKDVYLYPLVRRFRSRLCSDCELRNSARPCP